VPIAELVPMTSETADRWLDHIELDWVEDDPSVDALLRDVAVAEEVGEPTCDESAA
jgi:hypothetical protein